MNSVSDSTGNLLCYSDGYTVYNRNHMFMQNGYLFACTGYNQSVFPIMKNIPVVGSDDALGKFHATRTASN